MPFNAVKYNAVKYNPVEIILAPMAGVTDYAFRQVARECGAEMTYTEMVSAKALVYGDKKTGQLLSIGPGEHPSAAQIFGSDAECMGKAARIAAELSGADYIDVNMGCPVGKVVSNGDGSALMRSPELVKRILDEVVEMSPVPVTVKLRKGWDKSSENFIEIAKIAEDSGVSAVCLHARTRSQMYSGKADWDAIKELKKEVKIPVIANGDVFSAEDAERALRLTGCDAVMVGRGAFGNPWIFSEIRAKLEGKGDVKRPSIDEICDLAVRQFEIAAERKGEHIACLEARKHYAWYLRGIPYAGYYKEQIIGINTFEDIYRVTKGVRRDLKQV
ncbi:MAG: tRNA dihydrouridine synthase DusB [Oscillospiraceae bacterium]|jgi:nifR3 family TIM-barrel protein|nr:tRNA dihydrouridine synthase DusB [Oscillospiraceae bacterium]